MEQAAASLSAVRGGSLYLLGVGKVTLREEARRTPDQMRDIFADERRTRFLGKADRELVAAMYRELHEKVLDFDEQNLSQKARCNDACARRSCVLCPPWGAALSFVALLAGGVLLWMFPLLLASGWAGGDGHPSDAWALAWAFVSIAMMPLSSVLFFCLCCGHSASVWRVRRGGPARLPERQTQRRDQVSPTQPEAQSHSQPAAVQQQMSVVVPAGVEPGQTFVIVTPSGQQMQVVCPADAATGATIVVSVSAAYASVTL